MGPRIKTDILYTYLLAMFITVISSLWPARQLTLSHTYNIP